MQKLCAIIFVYKGVACMKLCKSFLFVISLFACVVIMSSCIFDSVVPCAWVKLDMEGYIYYSSNMYASGGDHIRLYESEEHANQQYANPLLSIVFYPRICGAMDIDGVRTTTVDISSNYSMTIYVTKTESAYSPEKKIYLNGEQLEPSNVDDLDTLYCMTFEDFTFVRGNPNGHLNNFVNTIEYK